MNVLSLVGAAFALLACAVLLLLIRIEVVRGVALALSIAVLTVFGGNSVPRSVWVPAFGLCAVFLVVAIARTGGIRRRGNPMFFLLFAWLGLTALGAIVNNSYSISRLVVYFGTTLLIVYVASELTRAELQVVLLSILVIAAAEVAWGAVESFAHLTPAWGYRGGTVRYNPYFSNQVPRAQGSLGQPIVYGTLMGVATIIAWSNSVVDLRPVLRIVAIGIGIAGLVLSGTRSAALAVVIGVLIHILFNREMARWLRNVLLVAAAGGIVALLNFGITGQINKLVASGSWVHRLESIQAIPALLGRPVIQALWGSGFGSEISLFNKGYIHLTFGLKVVDDFFVYLIGTTGIIGFVLFMAVIVYAFVRASRLGKALIGFWFAMFISFDVMVWLYTGVILSLVLALPGARDQAFRPASTDQQHLEARETLPTAGRPSAVRQ